jgi:hypothetical protein
MSGIFDIASSYIGKAAGDVGTSASNIASQNLAAAESIALNASDTISNTVKNTVMESPKCTYKSSIMGIDKNRYSIVSNDVSVLNSIGCICVDEENNPTPNKATLVTDSSPGLSTKDFQKNKNNKSSELLTPSIYTPSGYAYSEPPQIEYKKSVYYCKMT